MSNTMSKKLVLVLAVMLLAAGTAMAQMGSFGNYLGQYSDNGYAPYSSGNMHGAGNPNRVDSINNRNGRYGNPNSPWSATNPNAINTPRLYDSEGNYRGKLSANQHDPDSISNPHGRYGNPNSPYSINNSNGAGSRYLMDSPNNPYGRGLSIYGQD